MRIHQLQQHSDRLGFCPQPAVRWLSPGELCRTAIKVALSWVFANYADKREIQECLPASVIDHSDESARGLWLDFVADAGDGFDAAYTIASLIARHELRVDGSLDGKTPGRTLPRASLLVLGGDQAYPTASERAYEDRLKGPFRAALPMLPDPPLMVALPGNHDWYDGLTAFLRVFAQQRFIGAWRTAQTRSYFAVRLPHRWWLLGLDSQLGSYIDEPQLRYFQHNVTPALQPGDAVIICTATPAWVHCGEGDVDAFNSLHYFDREVVRYRRDPGTGERVETGASVRLWITGDRHHYARYAEEGTAAGLPLARQLVTCGLGGAYLSATHNLPSQLRLPPPTSRMREKETAVDFSLRSRYPSADDSRRLSLGLLSLGRRGLPRRNPGFWPLAGAVQVALFLVLSYLLGLVYHRSPIAAVRDSGPLAAAVLGGCVVGTVALVVLLRNLSAVAGRLRGREGRLHGPGLVALMFQLMVATAGVVAATALPWPADWSDGAVLASCLVGTLTVAGLVASYAFAAWIRLVRTEMTVDWQMSAQSIEDHKGFVRMHINVDGDVELYPLSVAKVCHEWKLVDDETMPGMKRPVPADELPNPCLIEEPVVISRASRQPYSPPRRDAVDDPGTPAIFAATSRTVRQAEVGLAPPTTHDR